MPDHVHGILNFNKPDCRDAKFCVSATTAMPTTNKFGPQSQNLASVIRGYKAAVKKYATINNIAFTWQPRYHDHVVREDRALQAIRRYIRNNPQKWIDSKNKITKTQNFPSVTLLPCEHK